LRPPSVKIIGNGFAAFAALRSLEKQDIPVHIDSAGAEQSPRPIPLVLDEVAARLLSELFGSEIFRGAQQLRRRFVNWGGETRLVSQPSLAISKSSLLTRIAGTLSAQARAEKPVETNWELIASERSSTPRFGKIEFGRRMTLSCEVALEPDHDPTVSRIESGSWGWMHLFPLGDRKGCLQATVPSPFSIDPDELMESLLAQCSTPLRRSIAGIAGFIDVQPSSPAISGQVAGERTLKIGSAALRFDPLCGDGTAQSVRTGILAAASVASSSEFGRTSVTHYERRIAATFAAHLGACSSFYRSGDFGPAWKHELSDIDRAWTSMSDARDGRFDFTFDNGILLKVR
jgi:hypothetical protein